MKKIFISLALICMSFTSTFATSLVNDFADIISSDTEQKLLQSVNDFSIENNFDIVILTTPSINGSSAKNYANTFYDQNNFGKNSSKDGCLLLISTDDREWYFLTNGYNAINSSALNNFEKNILPYFSSENYDKGFSEYINFVQTYVINAQNTPTSTINSTHFLIIALISAFIGITYILSLRKEMKTVDFVKHAKHYEVENSFDLSQKSDVFLFSTVSKVVKSSNSSGGRSRGGRGGRY